MSKINGWLGNSFPLAEYLDDWDQGVDVGQIVTDKPVSITIVRAGSAQAAQTVRIEEMRQPLEVSTAGGTTAMVDALLIGYAGYPDIDDTDVQHGDRFRSGGVDYEVVALVPGLASGVQAYLRVRA